MTNYVFYPVTGDGQSQATEFIWQVGQINWNTTADWDQGNTLVFQNPALSPGDVPGSGTGTSQGPGNDSVGLVAGDVTSFALEAYTPNPAKGDPYIGSNVFSVDVLINTGTVDINNLLLSGFNQYALIDIPQLPTLDVEGATLQVQGSIVNSQTVIFPTITNVPIIGTAGGTLLATGGGTIEIGDGGTVQIAGSVQSAINLDFNDPGSNLLSLGAVSASAPDAFAGTIDNFGAGDTIFLPNLPTPGSYTPDFSNGTLTIMDGATTLAALDMSGVYTSSSFTLLSADGGTDIVTCFAAGTRIRSTRGDIPVEDLTTGEHVYALLSDHEVPIVWSGRRRVDCRRHPKPELVWPVRIAAGAFADGVPERDVYLSPDHAVFVDGVLIPVKYLIDGQAIVQICRDEVVYYHLELPDHDVMLAEGLAVESYLDTDYRATFDNGPGPVVLQPEFGVRRWETAGCAQLVVTGAQLERVRQHLRARAEKGVGVGQVNSAAA
jgi:Hint domain